VAARLHLAPSLWHTFAHLLILLLFQEPDAVRKP